jgi:hypothetical protein
MKPILCIIAPLALLLVASCASHPKGDLAASRVPAQATQDPPTYGCITVTWELRYYVIGAKDRKADLRLLVVPDAAYRAQVDGFLMEVVEPKHYAGKVFMAHFDGAGGADPFAFYHLGKRYTEDVPEKAIGTIWPTVCR